MHFRNVKFSLSLFSFCFLLAAVHSAQAGENLNKLAVEIQHLIDSTKASVVTVASRFSHEVSVEKEGGFLSFFKKEYQKRAVTYVNIGTGIIFDKLGHILTRSSIVLGAESNSVILVDGSEVDAKFVGHDPQTGFAVLKISHPDLDPARLGNSDTILPGTLNLMIGNSLGVYPSFIFGWINAIRDDGMIQISASLNPGNNGCPIIDIDGKVVGLVAGLVNTQGDNQPSGNGIHFDQTTLAYPINRIKRIADDIIQHGHARRGWLGIVGSRNDLKPRIREIKKSSPAEKAGLIAGDVILKYADEEIMGITQLIRLVEYTPPGEVVPLEFLRNGGVSNIEVRIGEKTMTGSSAYGKTKVYLKSNIYSKRTDPDAIPAGSIDFLEKNQMLEERVGQLEKEIAELRKLIKAK